VTGGLSNESMQASPDEEKTAEGAGVGIAGVGAVGGGADEELGSVEDVESGVVILRRPLTQKTALSAFFASARDARLRSPVGAVPSDSESDGKRERFGILRVGRRIGEEEEGKFT
jgi:hypothetical protein